MLRNRRQKGFTLIELLIVIAIIGIIAALLIPNFLDSLQKGKQKRTMGDIKNMGTSVFALMTDWLGAAAAGQASTTNYDFNAPATKSWEEMTAILVPQYIQKLPQIDGWKGTYDFRLNDIADIADPQVMAIRSRGRLGVAETDDYEVNPFIPTDYEQDMVWADGFWVRWPSGDANTGTP
jgi:prepilin-type N-terminal cleavage/methylation domain-containing protein